MRLVLFGFGAALLSACTAPQRSPQLLLDTDGDGFYTSPACAPTAPNTPTPAPVRGADCGDELPPPADDCIVVPWPGACAALARSESVSLLGGEETCYQCLDALGEPSGPPQCEPGGGVVCAPVESEDPSFSCWSCVDTEGNAYLDCSAPSVGCFDDVDCGPDGFCQWLPPLCPPGALCPEVMQGVCVEQPLPCGSDTECPAGEICQALPWSCPEGMFCVAELTQVCAPPLPVDPCAVHTDAQGCEADPSCDYLPAELACEGEGCAPGACVSAPEGGCGDAAEGSPGAR